MELSACSRDAERNPGPLKRLAAGFFQMFRYVHPLGFPIPQVGA